MDQIRCFGNDRDFAQCVYCGRGPVETRDHVPARVLLDDPFPENLPVVPACRSCNQEFSLDEEYLACLIECTICGGSPSGGIRRPKVARRLAKRPKLAARLREARLNVNGSVAVHIEEKRVLATIVKLARGHAAFELHSPLVQSPARALAVPLLLMSKERREVFETPLIASVWPEVGSRAMIRMVEDNGGSSEWVEVQAGRYRYYAGTTRDLIVVRLVLSEYLAGEVIWTF